MVTISSLRQALCTPRLSFNRLSRMVWDGGEICRSTFFAEARVECDGRQYLIFMPLAQSSMRRVERVVPLHRHLVWSEVPRLEILRRELCYVDSRGEDFVCDILCEPLPDGEPFKDALAAVADEWDARRLIEAIDELQGGLLCANFSHNNLREENIIIDRKGCAHLLRWYYATDGVGGDDEAFDAIRAKISSSVDMALCQPSEVRYCAEAELAGHLFVRPMREGLAAVEHTLGWGFVDSENRVVIEPRYRWVNDFYEGRAEVETADGMGVIDREGRYVVMPIYDSVEYDVLSGCTHAWRGEECITFDYEGRQIESEGMAEAVEME